MPRQLPMAQTIMRRILQKIMADIDGRIVEMTSPTLLLEDFSYLGMHISALFLRNGQMIPRERPQTLSGNASRMREVDVVNKCAGGNRASVTLSSARNHELVVSCGVSERSCGFHSDQPRYPIRR